MVSENTKFTDKLYNLVIYVNAVTKAYILWVYVEIPG